MMSSQLLLHLLFNVILVILIIINHHQFTSIINPSTLPQQPTQQILTPFPSLDPKPFLNYNPILILVSIIMRTFKEVVCICNEGVLCVFRVDEICICIGITIKFGLFVVSVSVFVIAIVIIAIVIIIPLAFILFEGAD